MLHPIRFDGVRGYQLRTQSQQEKKEIRYTANTLLALKRPP